MQSILRLILTALLASVLYAVAQQSTFAESSSGQLATVPVERRGLLKESFVNGYSGAEVEQVLHVQQEAWNRHDLDGFMTGYWNSPDLTFFSGAKESKGWQATIDRYKATYTSPGHEMGKLDFSDLRVEILGPGSAFVRGVWRLTMSDGKTPHGRFTLIFRKFPDGWKIIHDHTSAAE